MAFGKCEKCEQPAKIKQSGKGIFFPCHRITGLILAYELDLGNSRSVKTVLGGISTTAGFVKLIIKGVCYISN